MWLAQAYHLTHASACCAVVMCDAGVTAARTSPSALHAPRGVLLWHCCCNAHTHTTHAMHTAHKHQQQRHHAPAALRAPAVPAVRRRQRLRSAAATQPASAPASPPPAAAAPASPPPAAAAPPAAAVRHRLRPAVPADAPAISLLLAEVCACARACVTHGALTHGCPAPHHNSTSAHA